MLKKFSLFLSSTLLLFFFVMPTFAQEAEIPTELREAGAVDCPRGSINTALGCINTSAEGFVNNILGLAVGIAGATALLLLLYGFFLLSTSQGNPDKVKLGKEVITSAIAGLIFVAMSVVLMGFIGINILGIPGLA